MTFVEVAECSGNPLTDESLICVFILYTVLEIVFFLCLANESNVSLIFLGRDSNNKVKAVVKKFPNTEEFELMECAW